MSAGASASNPDSIQLPSSNPPAPPSAAINRLSLSNCRLEVFKARRQHTDHRVALIRQPQGLADDIQLAAEAPLPEAVTDNDRTRRAVAIILFGMWFTPPRHNQGRPKIIAAMSGLSL
jgi:hypothetical protein